MIEVKARGVIEDLDYEIKRALEDAVTTILPSVQFDRDELFREFCRAVDRKTSTWEKVNDRNVNIKVKCRHCGERV